MFANSLRVCRPRPHLIPRLNETLPNKCSSCARRFEDSEKGRKEKRAHLDWHFRVHQRMAESVKRGQNRSWYVGEEVRILESCIIVVAYIACPIHEYTNNHMKTFERGEF